MSAKQVAASEIHALIEKPTLATVERQDGRATPVEPKVDATRTARIREVAYRLYEARGRADGHDVDDWLAAEAALTSGSAASATQMVGSGSTAP
jgi:hypothetical protein